ncbi:undecaprenyldiphospho-muramoylpentapeptide beta-N-acetylglucosaminyltransferase [Patescibacteria group bacterium]|nr:undecaprenyldiphospho-muramoylpentapeptide beta-N-acetylglucosaminyltransferase [Patescibacteria group bacterium]MBU4082593.1 undecaprenyldiphospho-muramoylpentapeptide beta-N-acetylglucosaminyltransferase [Patescibacteria group bacterium]MCG2808747.1 undecaprenyldiphospho-muramoylpentapeptide beta-N-acetylglucosaminyltransferase [Candidatus Portnoybacteria bacterium]
MRILFTGGGSGGHIFPLIAVAKELKKIHNQLSQPIGPGSETDLDLFFVGAGGFAENLSREGIEVKTILAGKMRRYFSWLNLVDLLKLPVGFFQSLWLVYQIMPDVIFSKGGYDSVPVALAGWIYGIPILVHESDATPGLANCFVAKLSKRVGVSFVSAESYFSSKKTVLLGNPIRADVIRLCSSDNEEDKKNAKKILGAAGQKPMLFVFGGSQGAQKINELVLEVLPRLLGKYEVIHQCGNKNYQWMKGKFGEKTPDGYYLFPFLDEKQLSAAYLLSDLIIARAGASNIFEIAACGRPSILIPIPKSAADHQRENAFAYAKAGAASVLEQDNLTPNLFLTEVNKILSDEEMSQKMVKNAGNFAQPEAANKIAQGLIDLGR